MLKNPVSNIGHWSAGQSIGCKIRFESSGTVHLLSQAGWNRYDLLSCLVLSCKLNE